MSSSLSEHYDRKYSTERDSSQISVIRPGAVITSRFDAIATYFPKYFTGRSVIELAAGDGSVAYTLLQTCPGIQSYLATDVSQPRLERLKNVIPDPRLSVAYLDAQEVGKANLAPVDAVIMVALIEHLVDPLGAMRQVRQLLNPGGFVYIDTPNIAKYTQRLKLLAGRFPSTASKDEGLTTFDNQPVDLHDEGHLHYFTYRSLSRMLTQYCGFSRVEYLAYPGGRTLLGGPVHSRLARWWPELFSELVLLAYA